MLHILEAIDKEKYDVCVYCPYEKGDMYRAIKKLNIPVNTASEKRWVYPHFNGLSFAFFDIRFLKAVKYIKDSAYKIVEILEREKPDIVLLNSMTLFWIASLAKALKMKTICFFRETLPKRGNIRNNLIRNALKEDMDKICYISNFDKTVVGSDDDKSRVIYDRVDENIFNVMSKQGAKEKLELSDKPHILYLGGMWNIKGGDVIASAMKDIDAKLIFMQYEPIGQRRLNINDCKGVKNKIKYLLGKEYEAKVIKIIEKNNIWDKFVFMPVKQDVTQLYSACDLVVFPSKLPHQSRPLYEAGMAMRPMIISDFQNTAEFAKDGENVLTFKAGDSKDLAKKINSLLEDEELLRKITENNYKQSIEQHNLSDLADDISKALDSL